MNTFDGMNLAFEEGLQKILDQYPDALVLGYDPAYLGPPIPVKPEFYVKDITRYDESIEITIGVHNSSWEMKFTINTLKMREKENKITSLRKRLKKKFGGRVQPQPVEKKKKKIKV